ncbi:MAG: PadR family transcriptional regulator [Cellulosilyticaceae bacterium]
MAIQLGGSLLDACVLAVVRREDVYGYRLTQEVREALEISESTLYPVLRRLQKEGCLETYDEPFQGRNRRYYKITDDGKQRYESFMTEWDVYKQKVDSVLIGGDQDE